MKRKNLVLSILVLFVGALSFAGCSTQKNYDMSYEQVISVLENRSKEMFDMFFNLDAQQKEINISTKVDTDTVNLDLDVQSQAKVDYESKVEDMNFDFDADVKVPESELDFTTSGTLKYSLIWDDMYLKLSKFSLKWPSASDLAMASMVVNWFKWQRFKLSMSGASMSQAFELHELYSEKMWDIVNNAWDSMINEGSGIYDWNFDEYKWYNAWKYSIDKEKFDEMLHMYIDMMNEFYSWIFAQYAQNLWSDNVDFPDFNNILSGIMYDNLQWYFVIVWKDDIVETMEDAYMNIDGTWYIVNYYYWKDWLYFEMNTEDWEDMMLIEAKKNWKIYNIYANLNSMLWLKWDIKINKFSKKDWIDADFDLNLTVNVDSDSLDDVEISENLEMELPLKWNYKVKNIDKFSVQEPADAVDLMEMLWSYMWSVDEQLPPDDLELD